MWPKFRLSILIYLGGLMMFFCAAVTSQPVRSGPQIGYRVARGQTLEVRAAVLVPPSSGHSQSPANPLTATLTMPVVPGINQPALLVITVGAVQEAPNTQIELVLPPGASILQGPDHWQVALRPGKTETFTVTIQFGRTGEQEVMVLLQNPLDANNALVGQGALGLTLEEKTGHLGFGPANASPGPPATSTTQAPGGPGRCLGIPALVGLGSVVYALRRKHRAKIEEVSP